MTDIYGAKILTMQDRVNFVEDVLEACNVEINNNGDKTYHPAVFDVVFKAYVLKYFVGVDLSNLSQDDLCELVYSQEYQEKLDNLIWIEQVDSLKDACLAQIERSHNEYLTVALLNKKDRLDELVDYLENWLDDMSEKFKNVDAKKLVASVDKIAKIAKNDNDTVAKKTVKAKNNLKVYSNEYYNPQQK